MADGYVDSLGELNKVKYDSFPAIFGKMKQLASQYNGLPMESLIDAFGTVTGRYNTMFTENPFVQNNRVKAISTRPANYSKDQVAKMVQAPEGSEQPLRSVERSLEYSDYPLQHMRMVYQNLLTYHSYVAPSLTDKEDAKDDAFWREWKLLEKLRLKMNPKESCHMLAGQAVQEGKVFYVPRVRVDKSHNKVEHAFLQQLPSDFTKIVGFNNVSKYTVAFNMMYFMQPGTDWRQFGDLFAPYVLDFENALVSKPDGLGTKLVYAAINMEKLRGSAYKDVEAYYQNGTWCYWVTLPVDKVFPFEIDDTDRNVIPFFVGLFIDLIQLSQMQVIQLELLQNPLISILHGEIPYWDDKAGGNVADEYKLSMAGLTLFQAMWQQMLAANNTSGIGLYAAPFNNMKLESLNEVPGATEIVSQGFTDVMSQAGLNALIPSTSDARAGAVQVSLQIESRLPQTVYRCYERMMNAIIERLNLNYEWRFVMFGDIATDEKREAALKGEMTLGILPAAIEYNAMRERSILDDIAWSDAVYESKLMDRRLPLITSYNAKQSESGLPPQAGRPESEDMGSSEGHEGDMDSPQREA